MNDNRVAKLQRDIGECRICVTHPLTAPLPHEPRPVIRLSTTAKLCIAGQAPGNLVNQTGIPFNDPSGDRLRDWMGLDRDTFYDASRLSIVPMGFCFPGNDAKGGDLPPRKECRAAWHDRIFEAMPQIELILVIGQYAQAYHLGDLRRKTLTETVANWRASFETSRTPRVLPLPHPSWRNSGWLKRNLWFGTDVLPVLRSEVKRLMLE